MLLQDPIEILLDMAKKGKIDPWDIDIVEVTDKFLKELERMRELNLRISARTLLYASMLVKMKSDTLMCDDFGVSEIEIPETIPISYTPMLDDYPVPKLPLRRKSKRRVTLSELIEELRRVEGESRSSMRVVERRRESTHEVIELAHEEDIKNVVERVEQALGNIPIRMMSFSELLDEIKDVSKVLVYLSLLFLATDGKIRLRQKKLFEELYIIKAV